MTTPIQQAGESPEVHLKRWCIQIAAGLNPKDAGDLISKASGIHRWVTDQSKEATGNG